MTIDDLQSRILYRDSNLILLDKPAGLAVHGGPRTPIHLEGQLEQLCFNLSSPPRLAHRLDRDTAGCLILARHDKAVTRLGRLFSAGLVKKTYWAVVIGGPDADQGCLEFGLSKISSVEKGWRMVIDAKGAASVTRWRVMGRGDGLCWLELKPETGRTHQIRVHCADGLGCPIIGDPVYGGQVGPYADSLLHLQSHDVTIPYWADRDPIVVKASPPPHMQDALRRCGWAG